MLSIFHGGYFNASTAAFGFALYWLYKRQPEYDRSKFVEHVLLYGGVANLAVAALLKFRRV